MTHTIKEEDLHAFMLEERVLFASSTKERKRLFVTLRGSYEVETYGPGGTAIIETTRLEKAVEIYNNITSTDTQP